MPIFPTSTTPASPVFLVEPNSGISVPFPLPVTLNGSTTLQAVSKPWTTVNIPTKIAVTNTSTELLAPNPNRLFIYIANNSPSLVYLQLGVPAVYGAGIRLSAGGVFTMSGSDLFLGQINSIGLNSNLIDILEGV